MHRAAWSVLRINIFVCKTLTVDPNHLIQFSYEYVLVIFFIFFAKLESAHQFHYETKELI